MHIRQFTFLIALSGAALLFGGSCDRKASHAGHDETAAQTDQGAGAETGGEAAAHAGHAGESGAIKLSDAQLREYGIEIMKAGPGDIETQAGFPGEILLNADRTVRVVPKAGGIVKEVRGSLGDRVRAGEVLAVIESRELAETAAEYLANRERCALAQTVFDREDGLRKKNISSEQEFLDARAGLAEALIQERAAKQKLLALGLSSTDIDALGARGENTASRYEIASPRDGTIIERHITAGDVVAGDTAVFAVADLETVWADFNVFQKDLPLVREGQRMTVSAGPAFPTPKERYSMWAGCSIRRNGPPWRGCCSRTVTAAGGPDFT